MTTITRFIQHARNSRAYTFMGSILLSLVGPLVESASAVPVTLTDGNSVAQFNTATQAGASSWTVDGVQQLEQQWFWFRVGNNPEASLDTLPITGESVSDTNADFNNDTLFTRFQGTGFQVTTKFSLGGGDPGSNVSDMGEQISIKNTGTGPLDFHFFQYTDFDLQGSPGGDSAIFQNANAVQQSKGSFRLSETVVTPSASHREIAFFPNTRNALNDGLPTTLSDTPAIGTSFGPGDVTWAFQWDFSIPAGATFQISKDKNLSVVPEPGSIALAATGLVAVLAVWSRRRRSR